MTPKPTLTEEDLTRIMHSEAKLEFVQYYKHTLTYEGVVEGIMFTVSYGGSGDDMYRERLGREETFKDLMEMACYVGYRLREEDDWTKCTPPENEAW